MKTLFLCLLCLFSINQVQSVDFLKRIAIISANAEGFFLTGHFKDRWIWTIDKLFSFVNKHNPHLIVLHFQEIYEVTFAGTFKKDFSTKDPGQSMKEFISALKLRKILPRMHFDTSPGAPNYTNPLTNYRCDDSFVNLALGTVICRYIKSSNNSVTISRLGVRNFGKKKEKSYGGFTDLNRGLMTRVIFNRTNFANPNLPMYFINVHLSSKSLKDRRIQFAKISEKTIRLIQESDLNLDRSAWFFTGNFNTRTGSNLDHYYDAQEFKDWRLNPLAYIFAQCVNYQLNFNLSIVDNPDKNDIKIREKCREVLKTVMANDEWSYYFNLARGSLAVQNSHVLNYLLYNQECLYSSEETCRFQFSKIGEGIVEYFNFKPTYSLNIKNGTRMCMKESQRILSYADRTFYTSLNKVVLKTMNHENEHIDLMNFNKISK